MNSNPNIIWFAKYRKRRAGFCNIDVNKLQDECCTQMGAVKAKSSARAFSQLSKQHHTNRASSSLSISAGNAHKKLVARLRSFKLERICNRVVPIWLAISS